MASDVRCLGTPDSEHIPVLVKEAVDGLRVRPHGTYVDGTAGLGGHAQRIAERLDAASGRLIALDCDAAAVERTKARLAAFPNVVVLHRNFGGLDKVLTELGIEAVDGVLFDFGISSVQLDDPLRGFSFEREGPLDMRMDPTVAATAAAKLAETTHDELVRVLRDYGDVRPAKRVAGAILARRDNGRLDTTRDLAEAVSEALHFVSGVPKETRTVFQAIRIWVNSELEWIDRGVRDAVAALAPGGRLVCIAFHGSEDRIVKR
ncbi:MAG TPA: 16S rRNA (cytosine(1402)-N(4))-methyltransferase RsmH, partial [Candidatus Hydrogenedentes bacterium]|nr:16S rRNA (cytosine(1402)-N(4))-methyltransferase RsmH [Candidatus Hydrogenedentota bacterium]